MAKRNYNNYRAKASSYYGRARNYARTYARPYARRVYTKVRNNKALRVTAPWTWLLGCAVGLFDFDDRIPAELKVGLGNMPLSGSVGGRVRNVASGLCFGDLCQKNILPRVGIYLGSAKRTTTAGGNAGNYV